MKKTDNIMGMPVSINIWDIDAKEEDTEKIFDYFRKIDRKFSTYKKDSEISKINEGLLGVKNASSEMKKILKLCEETKKETEGFFDIEHNGKLDPSGIVKGYTIREAGEMLKKMGYENFYVEIAGDIEFGGTNNGKPWRTGIESPFNRMQIVKVLSLTNCGIATSGNYIRGEHIYNPKTGETADSIASVTVVADNVYDSDRFATAAFAMGERGIDFLESREGVEAYIILKNKKAVMTSGFEKFVFK